MGTNVYEPADSYKFWPFQSRRLPSEKSPSLVNWEMIEKKLPWGVILLLGGGFALSDACTRTGFFTRHFWALIDIADDPKKLFVYWGNSWQYLVMLKSTLPMPNNTYQFQTMLTNSKQYLPIPTVIQVFLITVGPWAHCCETFYGRNLISFM